MGEDIVGVLNYYGFGDPFNIIAVFANVNNGPVIFALSYFMRIFLAGISFMMYCSEMNMKKEIIPIGAIIYSFSGFTIFGGGRYVEWLSIIIYFPIMVLGVERIVKRKNADLFLTFGVLYGALCGFYYLFMSSLAIAVYWCIRSIFVYRRKYRMYFISALRCLWKYVLGIMLSGPILVPALVAFFNSERKGIVLYVLREWRFYIPSISGLIEGLKETIIPGQSDMLGVTVIGYFCIIALLFKLKSNRNKQLLIGAILSGLAIAIPNVSWMFNAFAETNDRWFFIVHLFVGVTIVSVLGEIIGNNIRRVYIVTGVAIINILINTIGVLYYSDGGFANEMINAAESDKYILSPFSNSSVCDDKDVFRVVNSSLTGINGRPENVAMLNDYLGTTYWFSIVNVNSQIYADKLADAQLGHRSFGLSDNLYAEVLSGVKYKMLHSDESVPEGLKDQYEFIESINYYGAMWDIYRNNSYIGYSYCVGDDESFDYENTDITEYLGSLYSNIVPGAVKNEEFHNGIFSSEVSVDERCDFVASIPYSQAWEVYVDGNRHDVFKKAMFCAVKLDAGTHIVEFKYSYKYVRIGGVIMLLGIVILGICTYIDKRNEKDGKSSILYA